MSFQQAVQCRIPLYSYCPDNLKSHACRLGHTGRSTSLILLCCEVLWVKRVYCSAKSCTIVWGSYSYVDENLSSGTWSRVDWYIPDTRYQHFGGYFCVTFMVVKHYCLRMATLKMQAANNSELLVPTCKTSRFHVQEEWNFQYMSLLAQCLYHSLLISVFLSPASGIIIIIIFNYGLQPC
jgi:hypothetical protein